MARNQRRPQATSELRLEPLSDRCLLCEQKLWVAYHNARTVATLSELVRLRLVIRRCVNPECALYQQSRRPEQEGAFALPQGEFGLDVIALVGALRHADHRSVPEIHRELSSRGVVISERTVTNLLDRYEELVALRLSENSGLREKLEEQGRAVLAIDGLQPDVGHEVLWVVRECLSGEVLLARSILGGTEKDLKPLLEEVADAVRVPIEGVISDGQRAIRKTVGGALPGVPHQLCQFHYLREAAKEVYEADRHAKKELKKRVRGVRPIERELEGRDDPEAEVVRGYCLAVRSAITDDGRPPLSASGIKLHNRIEAIQMFHRAHSRDKRGIPRELERLQRMLIRALLQTAPLWPPIRLCYSWVHRAAHILANEERLRVEELRRDYRKLLREMSIRKEEAGALSGAVSLFLKVTKSYWKGLFRCYRFPFLARTNNDLEHHFSSVRYHERRASGRKGASPAMVVRGSVRMVAAVATPPEGLDPHDIRPMDLDRWRTLRASLERRRESRRAQLRFRRDPGAYLQRLEEQLLKQALLS